MVFQEMPAISCCHVTVLYSIIDKQSPLTVVGCYLLVHCQFVYQACLARPSSIKFRTSRKTCQPSYSLPMMASFTVFRDFYQLVTN